MDLSIKPDIFLELRTQWDIIPKTYDWTPVEKEVIYPAAQKILGDLKGKEALDIGCGKGIFTKFLSELGANTLGIDRNDTMLEYANRVSNQNARFKKLDIADMQSLGSNRFDVVSATFVLEHLDENILLDKVYENIYAVLKPGGIFLAVLPHPCFEHLHNTDDTKRIPHGGHHSYFENYLLRVTLKSSCGQTTTFWQRHHPLSHFMNSLSTSPLKIELFEELGSNNKLPAYIISLTTKQN